MTATDDAGAVEVYISAGSNVDPAHHLRFACRELIHRFGPIETSSVYQNPPVGFAGDDFLNFVLRFRSREPAEAILAEIERLHAIAGRVRGPRPYTPLDLDLLLYGDAVRSGAVRVPREDILRYGFVLAPLAELAPALRHPATGQTMSDLWAAFDKTGLRLTRRTDLDLN